MNMIRLAAGAALFAVVLVSGCCGSRCSTRDSFPPPTGYEAAPFVVPSTDEGSPQPTPMEQPPRYESGN